MIDVFMGLQSFRVTTSLFKRKSVNDIKRVFNPDSMIQHKLILQTVN